MRRTLLALFLLAATAAAAGKKVSVTGRIEKMPSPSACQALATHRIACSEVGLFSPSVNLDALVGKIVTVHGEDVGLPCPLVKVVSAHPPQAWLEACGTPAPGCVFRLKSCPGGLAVHTLFVAAAAGYFPIDPVTGTFLLDPPTTHVLFSVPHGQAGCLTIDVKIPPLPIVIGKTFHLQGARMDIGPVGPPILTNPLCVTILPPTVPCEVPNC